MKLDGYRIQTHLNQGVGQLFTRNGLNWSNTFPHILYALEQLPVVNAIFDGEIVALDKEGKTHFQNLQNSLKSKDDLNLQYYLFDLLYLNGKDLRDMPLIERKTMLAELLKEASPLLHISEHIEGSGEDFYQIACEERLEGIVSKLADSPYLSGRNDYWVKTKCSLRQEFVIGGWSEPRGGRTGIGALLLGTYEKKKLRYVGRVGTGFNHRTLIELKKELAPLETDESPFDLNIPSGRDVHWVQPDKLCEVSFGSWTNEGILRTPVFQGMREDKAAGEVIKETPKGISSPDKIIFKKEKITKEEVLAYYRTISKTMLPYMEDRPLSLVRCPNGSEGQCFFQKHISGKVPDAFHTFPITEEKGEGIYLSINSPRGLEELVQLNAFELHAWNCQADNYMRPDQIVIDFDPGPGVPWKAVVEAAFDLKEILEDLDLTSFVKLTGGKGLHVHIPVLPLYEWDQIKSFAEALALEMVARDPKKFTANMSKNLRRGKIFVDYLRNGYGATAVVPYSLRAKPLSAVALPLEWTELRRIKGPQEFTMYKALKKIKSRKKDPWADMMKLKQRITILAPAKKKLAA